MFYLFLLITFRLVTRTAYCFHRVIIFIRKRHAINYEFYAFCLMYFIVFYVRNVTTGSNQIS